MKPLAITGLGVLTSIGTGRDALMAALADVPASRAKSFGTPTAIDAEKCPNAVAAEVWGFDAASYLGDKGLRNFDRLTKLLIVAAKQALEDAGLKKNGEFLTEKPENIGIVSSTAYGSLDAITELNLVAELEDPRYINPARFPNTVINAAAGYVSIWEDLRAPNVTIVDGNCGSLDAVLTAQTHLAHDRGRVFLVGGGEVLSDPLYLAFRKLEVVAEDDAAWMPGDPASRGIRLGEAAVFFALEEEAHAQARAARVLGHIVGYGTSFDPPESEALLVNVSSEGVARAVRAALADAKLSAADVDVVCSSVSGIPQLDTAELAGLSAVVPQAAIVAPKMLYGETFGAAGAVGVASALSWLSGAAKPAPIVSGDAPKQVRNVVVTAVGYYGNVSAVVVSK